MVGHWFSSPGPWPTCVVGRQIYKPWQWVFSRALVTWPRPLPYLYGEYQALEPQGWGSDRSQVAWPGFLAHLCAWGQGGLVCEPREQWAQWVPGHLAWVFGLPVLRGEKGWVCEP